VAVLSSIGGSDLGDIIRRMVRKILKNSVMEKFSLHGKKNKELFKDLEIYKII